MATTGIQTTASAMPTQVMVLCHGRGYPFVETFPSTRLPERKKYRHCVQPKPMCVPSHIANVTNPRQDNVILAISALADAPPI